MVQKNLMIAEENKNKLFDETLKTIVNDSFKCFNPRLYIEEHGVIFVTDTDGNVISTIRIGEKAEPAIHVAPYRNWENPELYFQPLAGCFVLAIPIFQTIKEGKEVIGILGATISHKQLLNEALSFMKGVRAFLSVSVHNYYEKIISEIAEGAGKSLELKAILTFVAGKITETVGKGHCSIAFLDEENQYLTFKWSTDPGMAGEKSFRISVPPEEKEKINPFLKAIQTNSTVSSKNFLHDQGLEDFAGFSNFVVVPLLYRNHPFGLIWVHAKDGDAYSEEEVEFIERTAQKIAVAVHHARVYEQVQQTSQKRDMLFEITKKIHSSIDVDEVLQEIIDNIKHLYPKMRIDLWLSHDSFSTTLPVKQFHFHGQEDDDISLQAYMGGQIIVRINNNDGDLPGMSLAAPLRGKQGIYGVLQLSTDQSVILDKLEIEYISILADIAGNAFENAQLYLQSKNLIRELRLINEMAQQLNKSLDLKQILSYVTKTLEKTFHAEYCAILRKNPYHDEFTVVSASYPSHVCQVVPADQGIIGQLYHLREPLFVAENKDGFDGYPLFQYQSLLGVPLINGKEISGILLVLDPRPHYFTFDDFKLLQVLAQHTNLAITNASLHAEVERMVITDNLTGLYNRKFLNENMWHSLERDSFGTLLLIDVDYFKNINDTYGHQTGDSILIQVSKIIKHHVRENDIAARWGGEEFAVYLPLIDIDIGFKIAERIRKNVEENTKPKVTVSCGIAYWHKNMDEKISVESVFARADEALYKAKRSGRNQVVVLSK